MKLPEAAGAAAKAILRDLIGAAGLGLIVFGVAQWSEPAATILTGLLCVLLAVIWARQD